MDTSRLPSFVPSLPWTFCPLNVNFHINRPKRTGCPWDVPNLSPGRSRGIPTTKFLYVIFLYRFLFSIFRRLKPHNSLASPKAHKAPPSSISENRAKTSKKRNKATRAGQTNKDGSANNIPQRSKTSKQINQATTMNKQIQIYLLAVGNYLSTGRKRAGQ